MGTDTKYYWYTMHNRMPAYDWMYIRANGHCGFEKEPSYEIVERLDLRDEFYGTFGELKARVRF